MIFFVFIFIWDFWALFFFSVAVVVWGGEDDVGGADAAVVGEGEKTGEGRDEESHRGQ